MGCGLSKPRSSVHPLDPDRAYPALTVAPASTPEPANYEEPANLPGQPLEPQRPPLVRQSQMGDCVVGNLDSEHSPLSSRTERKEQRLSTGSTGSNSSSPDPLASMFSQPAPPLPSSPAGAANNRSPFPPSMPLNSATRQYGTDSQIEFFKMLDKRVNEGPDYERAQAHTRSSSLTHRQSH